MKCDVLRVRVTYPCLWFCVYDVKRSVGGVARNNLVFSALSIFRVEGSVTLKMLNLFIVNQ